MTVTPIQVKNVPAHVPGEGMAEIVRRVAQWHKSGAVGYAEASGAINLFELPGNSLVLRSGIMVTSVWSASGSAAAATGTLTIPNDTGTLTVLDAANVALQSSGWHPSTADGVILPSSGGMVIFNYTTSTSGASTNAAGSFEAYVEYIQLADKL